MTCLSFEISGRSLVAAAHDAKLPGATVVVAGVLGVVADVVLYG